MAELSDRVQWDTVAEVEAKYAHTYDHRAGEVIVAYVLASSLQSESAQYEIGAAQERAQRWARARQHVATSEAG